MRLDPRCLDEPWILHAIAAAWGLLPALLLWREKGNSNCVIVGPIAERSQPSVHLGA